eukprot:356032-Chlamydomonas_euryale.AAC.2
MCETVDAHKGAHACVCVCVAEEWEVAWQPVIHAADVKARATAVYIGAPLPCRPTITRRPPGPFPLRPPFHPCVQLSTVACNLGKRACLTRHGAHGGGPKFF